MSGRNHSRPSRHRSTQECQCHQFSSSLILVSSSHVGFTFSRWISRRGAVACGRDVLRVLRLRLVLSRDFVAVFASVFRSVFYFDVMTRQQKIPRANTEQNLLDSE
eukprot:scaffold51210_cov53-Cyclotella_meneghiniana.AAC.2